MTQPSTPTLTPVVGVPATITNLATLRGQATFDGPYLGGPVGAGIGSIPFEWDTASSGWKNSNTDGPLELPLARGDVLAAAKPHGWLYIDLTWTDEAGRRQSEQLRFRPAAGEDGTLDLTRDQDPEAYTTTASLQALTADAEQAAAAANTAAGRVNDAILDLSAERQAVADIIADTAQSGDRADAAAAEALGAAGITPAYISDTTADPPAAPNGTYGAKLTTGNLWQRVKRVAGAWQASGSPLLTLLGIQLRQGVSLADYGLTGGGDIYGPLTQAIADAPDGAVIRIPPGHFNQSAEIVYPETKSIIIEGAGGWQGTTITATAAMRSQFYKGTNAGVFGSGLKRVTLRGNLLAERNIMWIAGKQWELRRVKLLNATKSNITLADGVTGGAQFYELQASRLYIENDVATFTAAGLPLPDYNIEALLGHTDSHWTDIVLKNWKKAALYGDSGNVMWVNVHAYGFPFAATGDYVFDLKSLNYMTHAYADGPWKIAAVRFRGYANTLTAPILYCPDTQSLAPFLLDGAGAVENVARDVQVTGAYTGTGLITLNAGAVAAFNEIGGPKWGNSALSVGGAAGQARPIRFFSGNKERWRVGLESSTETGSGNTGSNWSIQRRTDAGNFLEDTLILFRNSGYLALGGIYGALERLHVNGNIRADGNFISNGAAGSNRVLQFLTAGTLRWALRADAVAEAGSNAGSNLLITRYADNGAYLSDIVQINRSNGNVGIGGTPFVPLDVYGQMRGTGAAVTGAAGTTREIGLQTAGIGRWGLRANTGPESGGNAGSDFTLTRKDDGGAFVEDTIVVRRSNGNVGIGSGVIAGERLQVGGNIRADGNLLSNGIAGANRDVLWTTAGVGRWRARAASGAETGSNAGSDWALERLTDAGGFLGQSILVSRATGAVTMTDSTVTVAGAWQKPFQLGAYSLWVEVATGKLRIKAGTPTSDADGTVVGTQA